MFIHVFREYCNQDIDENELIHTLADMNKKLRDLENNISVSKNEVRLWQTNNGPTGIFIPFRLIKK